MKGYRKTSHTTYSLHYHFVCIPKYRKPVLRGDVAHASLHFSPSGEAKWVKGLSGRGAGRLARAGVLEQYVEHGKQAQRSPGGRIACFDRRVVRNAG